MTRFRSTYCVLVALLLVCCSTTMYAKKPRAYMLGGGGSNMSGNQWRFDRNGLRTGTTGYVHNLFGIYMDGSYASFYNTIPICPSVPNGYGAGGGICYEHQQGNFKFQIGLGIRYQNVSCSVSDTTFYDSNVSDAWGYPYTLRYDFTKRVDHTIVWNTQLPILLGWGTHGFYFLGGVKLNYKVYDQSSIVTTSTTSGTYPQYLGQFFEMDNHGFRKEVDIKRDGIKIDFKPDVILSVETGYEWSSDMKIKHALVYDPNGGRFEYRFRLAAFVEYGLVNICPKQDNLLVAIPSNYKWDVGRYELNHVFSTNVSKPCSIHNFYAGAKLTILIGSYKDKRCVLCTGWKTEADISGANGKPQKR